MKKFLKILFLILFSSGITLYLGLVFLLPQIISNKVTINKLQSFIRNKTGIETNITGLNLRISPKLDTVLNIDSVNAKNNDISIADINNFSLSYKLLKNELTSVNASNIYIDGNSLQQFKKQEKKEAKKNFELKKLPEINIQKLTYKSDKVSIFGENINAKDGLVQLKANINTPYLKEPLKLGNSGTLQAAENELNANQFEIILGNSHLYINGLLFDKNKKLNFDLKGENLPVSELMAALLYFQKAQDSSRRFIENFKNFNGTANVDLKINNDGIWGKCIGNNLSGNAVWFDIPIYFKEAVFDFNGKEVKSVAEGILGNEKVTHTLDITELGTPEKEVIGKMFTTLTKKFHYVPNLTILNSVNASLVYKIKYKKPDVYYNVDIPTNSDLIYNSFYLGLREHHRKIFANTFKDGNDLYLKEFKYSYLASEKENVVVSGDALFIKNIDKKNPDKFIPQYLNCRTNGYAPTSVIGSFGEKVAGGEFRGDLKYDFVNNQVLGTFDIIKAKFAAFRIDNAHIVAKSGILNITSNGLFNGEKYKAELNAKNNIFGETLVYNMKLFLDKLIFETTPDDNKDNKDKSSKKIDSKDISKKVQDIAITVNNWEITINKIIRDKFILENVKLLGSMKKDIFNFKMEELNFADGTINANGIYDFAKDISKMSFEAKNINSNKAANMMLNLNDQIDGTANVKVELKAKEMFKFIDAHTSFEILEGFLPKLGNTELMIKNSKVKLSDITNIDLSQKELMKDDIKGTFDVHNTEINNINITTWHELSAVFLEGSYEMEKQYADLQLYWHYSKEAPKGARVFGIPFGLILKVIFRPEHSKEMYQEKLTKIPKINADERNSNYYRIFLKGDINNNKTNLTLKEIK